MAEDTDRNGWGGRVRRKATNSRPRTVDDVIRELGLIRARMVTLKATGQAESIAEAIALIQAARGVRVDDLTDDRLAAQLEEAARTLDSSLLECAALRIRRRSGSWPPLLP